MTPLFLGCLFPLFIFWKWYSFADSSVDIVVTIALLKLLPCFITATMARSYFSHT